MLSLPQLEEQREVPFGQLSSAVPRLVLRHNLSLIYRFGEAHSSGVARLSQIQRDRADVLPFIAPDWLSPRDIDLGLHQVLLLLAQ